MDTNILKPTEADLAPLIAEATGTLALTLWKPTYLAGINALLTKDPLIYRSFGPWWWLVKNELVKSGNFEFGTDVDAEWVEYLDYGRVELNLLAAHGYMEWRCDEMNDAHGEAHTLECDDGEFIDYLLTDIDMEEREKMKL